MSNEETMDMDKLTLYELAFNIIPTQGDEGAQKTFESVKEYVEKVKVDYMSVSEPALLPLKYTMSKTVESKKSKNNSAYFAWIKFDAMPESIAILKEAVDHEVFVLRYMIIKAEKETNTSTEAVAEMLSDKKEGEEGEKTEKKESQAKEDEEVVEEEGEIEVEASTDDEVDKAIDEIVGEEKEGIVG